MHRAAHVFAEIRGPLEPYVGHSAGWVGRAIAGVDKVDAPITLDRALTSMWSQGIGAEIMGRRKFGPQTGPWPDDGWRGWWDDDPPFHTPV